MTMNSSAYDETDLLVRCSSKNVVSKVVAQTSMHIKEKTMVSMNRAHDIVYFYTTKYW